VASFAGFEVEKAKGLPAGVNARPADDLMRSMQAALRDGRNRRKMSEFAGVPLDRDPRWTRNEFGPSDPLPAAPLDDPRSDTHQPDPRLYEYPVAWNVTIGRERHVPWEMLKRSSELPIFRACIELRKTELSSMEWGIRINPKVASRIAANTDKNRDQVAAELRKQHQAEIVRTGVTSPSGSGWLLMSS
jgi:hypothetical protein